MPHEAFFSGDAGIKYVQVKNLIAKGYSDVSLEYLGQDIDPGSQISPFRLKPSLYIKDGRNYSVFPLAFPFLSTFGYRVFGPAGLYLLPLVSALLSLGLVYGISRRILSRNFALMAMFASLFLPPLLFYSLTFWEHLPMVGLFLLAIYLLLKSELSAGRGLLAGIILGLSVWFRSEMLILGLGLLFSGALFLDHRKPLAMALLGFVGLVLAMLVFNQLIYGDWFNHISLNVEATTGGGLSTQIFDRLGAFRRSIIGLNLPQTIAQDRAGWGNSMGLIGENFILEWLAGSFVVMALLLTGLARWRFSPVPFAWAQLILAAGSGLVTAFYLLTQINDQSPLLTGLASGGLFPFAPLIILALFWPLHGKWSKTSHRPFFWLFAVCLGFVLVMPFLAPNDGGMRFGPRYLLPVIPLLSILAFFTIEGLTRIIGRPFVWSVVVVLVLISGSVQGRGYWILQQKKAIHTELTEAVLNTGIQRIAMDQWWMIFGASPVVISDKVHIILSDKNMLELVHRARIVGDQELLFCMQGDVSRFPIPPKRLGVRVTERRVITRPSSTYFGFTLFSLRILPEH